MSGSVFVETTVGRLAVTTLGRGAPAVLWHSLFVDERSWQRVTGEFAPDRALIVITGPGHGRSSDPGRRYSLLQCADAAAEVLDALDITEPVDWVGNAWGGHVGVRFATAYPHRIRSLVTLGTPIQALSAGERMRTRVLLQAHRLLGPVGFITNAVADTLLAPETRAHDPEAVALVHSTFVEADRQRLRTAVASISLQREDLASLLPAIAVPTLMITGAQHSGWTPDQAASVVLALPDGRVEVVDDAAYLVPLEQPEAVVSLVRDFWASVPSEQPKGRNRRAG